MPSPRERRPTPPIDRGSGRAATSAGFTLIEIMVVIAIAALLLQLVVTNIGAMIPARALDSEAAQLVSRLDYMRSESRLQGKIHKVELDLTNNRFRVILPPEDRLLSTDVISESVELGWTGLDENVQFAGYQIAGGPLLRSGEVEIVFDQNGFTADQSIYLSHVTDADMVWTIQVRGLMGTSRIMQSFDGHMQPLDVMEEGRF